MINDIFVDLGLLDRVEDKDMLGSKTGGYGKNATMTLETENEAGTKIIERASFEDSKPVSVATEITNKHGDKFTTIEHSNGTNDLKAEFNGILLFDQRACAELNLSYDEDQKMFNTYFEFMYFIRRLVVEGEKISEGQIGAIKAKLDKEFFKKEENESVFGNVLQGLSHEDNLVNNETETSNSIVEGTNEKETDEIEKDEKEK
ncbi:MAG: hypothetical protein N4A47_04120 [Clostridia bacterium]|jgi:hypothetical protein|nr:hypothetical protein [Clostridia bacterium]